MMMMLLLLLMMMMTMSLRICSSLILAQLAELYSITVQELSMCMCVCVLTRVDQIITATRIDL